MKRNNVGVIVGVLFCVIEILILVLLAIINSSTYLFDRFFVLSVLNCFVCCHFIFPIKKMYDFIYKKRYIIGLIILIVVTLLKYHGSSLSLWNVVVQPIHHLVNDGRVFGTLRDIRADEYFITTPSLISQHYNNFNSVSNILMGVNGYVNMVPNLPSRDISIVGNLCNLPYLFLPLENAFSMSWFMKVFLIFFASFELCMLVTDKKKLYALMGAMAITFSGASCWWSNMLILGWGALAVVIMHLFLKSKSVKKRIVYSILMGVVGANYLMMMYPAWQVPFGYLYLGFFIWLWLKNKKELSFKLLLYVPVVLGVMFGIFLPVFLESYDIYLKTISTVYPGGRVSVGGDGFIQLFSSYLSIFFPFKYFFNSSEYANFMCFYPIPIIYSICLWIKKIKSKIKMDSLLIILTVIAIFLSIWNYIELPEWFTRITLLSFSTSGRSQLVVGYICVFMLIRLMSKYENDKTLTKERIFISGCISFVFNIFVIAIVNFNFGDYVTWYMNLIIIVLFIPLVMLIILNNKKTNFIVALSLIGISILTGVMVNPLGKGLAVFYEKPIAKEIRDIVSEDKDGRWLVISKHYAMPNYTIANGAVTINSTNYYPNLELWKKIDPDKEYIDIYNRYAHIQVRLTIGETKFELLTPDNFLIHLNVNDLKKIDVDYILTDSNLNRYIGGFSEWLHEDGGLHIFSIKDDEVD